MLLIYKDVLIKKKWSECKQNLQHHMHASSIGNHAQSKETPQKIKTPRGRVLLLLDSSSIGSAYSYLYLSSYQKPLLYVAPEQH